VSAEPALASDTGDRRDMSPSILEECEQLRLRQSRAGAGAVDTAPTHATVCFTKQRASRKLVSDE
jgi:hypothetical protein